MGKKDAKVIALVSILLAIPIVAHAETVDDLHTLYGIETVHEDLSAEEDVVHRYEDVRRFVAMYNYVDLSTPDTATQDMRIKEIDKEISDTEAQLLDGFYLSFEEITILEDKLTSALTYRSYVLGTYDYVMVDVDIPGVNEVPSYQQYQDALDALSRSSSYVEVGDLSSLPYPIVGDCTLVNQTGNYTYFSVDGRKPVISLFNGTVLYVGDNGITIGIKDVTIQYENMETVSVEVGATIEQYDIIGYATDGVLVNLWIGDERVDMSKLYVEVVE